MINKTVFITLLAILINLSAHAQIKQGKLWVGASTSFLSSDSEKGQIRFFSNQQMSQNGSTDSRYGISVNLAPKVGYTFTKNLVAGLSTYGSYISQDQGGTENSKTNIYMGGPFLRYYFTGEKVIPYIEGTGQFGSSKRYYNLLFESGQPPFDVVYFSEEYKTLTYIFEIGLAIPMGEKAMIDLSGNFTSFTTKRKGENPNDIRDVERSLGLKVGFNVFLGK
jgi:hypothetical protein